MKPNGHEIVETRKTTRTYETQATGHQVTVVMTLKTAIQEVRSSDLVKLWSV